MIQMVSKTNQKLINKSEALKKIHEHNRDYLSVDVTIPLGNKALKKVHTNQWLFTKLPKEFDLANWTILAKVLNSNTNRYEKYVKNRWYIEGVETNVEAGGKAEMKLKVNAFASSYNSYTETARSVQQAFTDATQKTTTTTNNTKKKTNATNNNNTKLFPTKAGKNVGSDLSKAVAKITEGCNTEEQRAYCIYDWVDKYVSYKLYWGYKYSSNQVLTGHIANCYDTAFLIYNLCTKCKPKVRCEIYNGRYHFVDGTWDHLWNKLPYKNKMTFADTGRSGRNPIGNHGSGRYIVSGGGSPYRKNY